MTHRLTVENPPQNLKELQVDGANGPINLDVECREFLAFKPKGNEKLAPRWNRKYGKYVHLWHIPGPEKSPIGIEWLKAGDPPYETDARDPSNPFWIVRADSLMIRGHSDIENPLLIDFVRRVYDDVIRQEENQDCAGVPKMAAIDSD